MLYFSVWTKCGGGIRGGLLRGVVSLGGKGSEASFAGHGGGSQAKLQVRTISAKASRTNIIKPPPWPYQKYGYNGVHKFWDWTCKRMDENSKLIVVEGNIGSGKSLLAKELAELLDFHYIPSFSMDDIMVNMYGVDRRDYYHYIPPSCAVPDIKMFHENPYNKFNAQFQQHMMFGKYEQYLNALTHILNTGQGVILERSPHSDFIFANAMRQKDFITKDYFRIYHYQRRMVMPQLVHWPHLVIYLDTPVEECLKRIQKRGIDYENNRKVVDAEYLTTIRESYKDVMKDFAEHSRVLTYDWQTAADADQVLEDIEKLDLDWWEWHSGDVLEEWVQMSEIPADQYWNWNYYRLHYTQKFPIEYFEMVDKVECEELNVSLADLRQNEAVMKKFVFGPYRAGFNLDRGDPLSWQVLLPTNTNRPAVYFDWYEHYWKDVWYEYYTTHDSGFDVTGDDWFNPEYNEAHH